jgi:hypothetical protein
MGKAMPSLPRTIVAQSEKRHQAIWIDGTQ